MRAVRRTERGVEVLDLDAPAGEGVDVHIGAAGICGTDVRVAAAGPHPVTLGHELAGRLDDGTAVAIEPIAPCGTCDQCQASRYHLCRGGPDIFIGWGLDGGMADIVRVPERALVPLPPSLGVGDACLVEPLAVAVHGLRLAGVQGGDRVAVIGGGSIGLCASAAATSLGCEVGLVARHDAQVTAGERLGATAAISGEYDVVVEAAGSESAMAQAVALARPRATLLVLGTYWGLLPVPAVEATMKELRVLPTITYNRHASGRDVDGAAALLAARPEIAEAMITHRFPLDDAPHAFDVAADRAAGAIKVVLEP